MPRFGRRIAKATRGIRRFANKRYFKKKSGYQPKIGKIMSDLSVLKSLVNAEKKTHIVTNIENLGQVNYNSNGALVETITPTPAEGTGSSERTGDSIKIVTAMARFQFQHQTNTTIATNLLVEIYEVLGTPQAPSVVTTQLWKPNPFVTGADIRDYNGLVDQDYRQQYRIVARRKCKVPADHFSGQRRVLQLTIPMKLKKFGHHVKFADGSTTVASGQLVLCIRADSGNMHASSSSTLTGVAFSGVLTGVTARYSFNFYYFDN